jgi:hypothetical protein
VFLRRNDLYPEPKVLCKYPPADVTIERIGDLLDIDMPARFGAGLARSLFA